jgi:hypothetical protein
MNRADFNGYVSKRKWTAMNRALFRLLESNQCLIALYWAILKPPEQVAEFYLLRKYILK